MYINDLINLRSVSRGKKKAGSPAGRRGRSGTPQPTKIHIGRLTRNVLKVLRIRLNQKKFYNRETI